MRATAPPSTATYYPDVRGRPSPVEPGADRVQAALAATGAAWVLWQSSAVVAGYQRRRLWGIAEEAVDAFDALVAAAMSSGGGDQSRQRRLLTLVLEGLVGAGDGGGRAVIQASAMRSGFPAAAAARAWIVDLLAAAARQQAEQWWPGCDDDGDPAIHGMPLSGSATGPVWPARSSTAGSR